MTITRGKKENNRISQQIVEVKQKKKNNLSERNLTRGLRIRQKTI